MRPALRPSDTRWISHEGRPALLLRDRLGLSDRMVIVPQALVALLVLCDGTRDIGELRTAFELRSGQSLTMASLERILSQLDEALLLQSPRSEGAVADALRRYREAPQRDAALAGASYPAEPDELRSLLDGYLAQVATPGLPGGNGLRPLRGLICPHIDYHRGAAAYARAWQPARQAVQEADLVVILGTDHNSGRLLTLTRQNYSTPFGVLPTAGSVVDEVVAALDGEDVFATELHHRSEHSIELAAVWLHHALDGQPREILPILCGSFEPYTTPGGADPAADPVISLCLEAIHRAARGRRLLVIAAADLAHVGPAFGDSQPYGPRERQMLRDHDQSLLDAVVRGSASSFFALLQAEEDRYRVCGLPPIYLALRLLGQSEGRVVAYEQCPADDAGGSFVSVAGALLY